MRSMLVAALSRAGGEDYLLEQATANARRHDASLHDAYPILSRRREPNPLPTNPNPRKRCGCDIFPSPVLTTLGQSRPAAACRSWSRLGSPSAIRQGTSATGTLREAVQQKNIHRGTTGDSAPGHAKSAGDPHSRSRVAELPCCHVNDDAKPRGGKGAGNIISAIRASTGDAALLQCTEIR